MTSRTLWNWLLYPLRRVVWREVWRFMRQTGLIR